MMVKLTTVQAKSAVRKYADCQKTIRQLAIEYDVTYEQMRKIMVKAGYSNGLKVRLHLKPVLINGQAFCYNKNHKMGSARFSRLVGYFKLFVDCYCKHAFEVLYF